MTKLKSILFLTAALFIFSSCEEKKEATEDAGEKMKFESRESITREAEQEVVSKLMKSYKNALENLTTEGTFKLFSDSSEVYESGGVEGTYKEYIDQHLGPELGHFESFKYSDYKLDVDVDLPYAFTTETYVYTIIFNEEEEEGEQRKIQKKGVATSILKRNEDTWKIIKTHSSSRNYNPKQ